MPQLLLEHLNLLVIQYPMHLLHIGYKIGMVEVQFRNMDWFPNLCHCLNKFQVLLHLIIQLVSTNP